MVDLNTNISILPLNENDLNTEIQSIIIRMNNEKKPIICYL